MNPHDENDDCGQVPEPDDGWLDAVLRAADQEMHNFVRARIDNHSGAEKEDPGDGASEPSVVHESRAVFWQLGRRQDLSLALQSTEELTAAIDLALDVVLAIGGARGLDSARALVLAICANLAVARDFEPGSARASVLAFAVDTPLSPDQTDAARAAGRSRLLDFAAVIARILVRAVPDSAVGICESVTALARALERARDAQIGQAIVQPVEGVQIDASDADLSRLRLDGVPLGTVWSDRTRWPSSVDARIRTLSRRFWPGEYQVVVRDL